MKPAVQENIVVANPFEGCACVFGSDGSIDASKKSCCKKYKKKGKFCGGCPKK